MSIKKDKEEELPPYIQKYLDSLEYEGYVEFVGIANRHKQALKDYDEITYPNQQVTLGITNRLTGKNEQIDQAAAKRNINLEFEEEALNEAKRRGYHEKETEKIPEKPQAPNEIKPSQATHPAKLTTAQSKRETFLQEMRGIQGNQKEVEKERD